MLIVPFTSDYDQTFRVQLGDETYAIDARWNERAQYWTFDLTRDSDSTLLVAGVPLLIGQDVLSPYALGIGGFVVADLSSTSSDAGPDDFSDRVVVIHFTPAELAILAANGVAGVSGGGVPVPSPTPIPTPGPTPGGGGGGGGSGGGGTTIINNLSIVGGGFGSDREQADSSGNEVLAYQWPFNAALNPNSTLKAIAQMITDGDGTIRLYVGTAKGVLGDTGAPSGTLVGSAHVTGSGADAFISGTPVANPGGVVYVKLTIQADPVQTVQIDVVQGAFG